MQVHFFISKNSKFYLGTGTIGTRDRQNNEEDVTLHKTPNILPFPRPRAKPMVSVSKTRAHKIKQEL